MRQLLVVPAIVTLAALSGCTSPLHEVDTVPLEPVAVETHGEMHVETPEVTVVVEAPVVAEPAVDDTAKPAAPVVAEAPVAVEPTPTPEPEPEVAADDGLVRVQIAKGDTFKYSGSTISDMVMNIEMMGMEVKNHTEIEQDISMEVLGQRDLGWDIRITFDDIRIKGKSENPMMGTTEFDSTSDDAAADPQTAMVIEMATMAKGKSVDVTLSDDGRVAEIRGLEAITPELPGGMGGMMGGGAGAGEQQIREFFFALPETAPTQGMKWNTTRSQDAGPMKMGFSTDHVVNRLSAAALGIDITGDVTLEVPETDDAPADEDFQMAAMREMMKTMKLDSAAMTGAIELSRADGLIQSRSSDLKMTMQMENAQTGKMTIEQSVTSTMKRTK